MPIYLTIQTKKYILLQVKTTKGGIMAELKFEIVEKLGVLSTKSNGWRKELNLVSWNKRDAKYDLREWNEDYTRMSKGVTFTEEEAEILKNILEDEFDK